MDLVDLTPLFNTNGTARYIIEIFCTVAILLLSLLLGDEHFNGGDYACRSARARCMHARERMRTRVRLRSMNVGLHQPESPSYLTLFDAVL